MASSPKVIFRSPKLKRAFDEPDEWVGLTTRKSAGTNDDQVAVRACLTRGKHADTSSLQVTYGKDVYELLGWVAGDYIAVQHSRIRPHLLRLIKADKVTGYKMGTSHNAPTKLYMKFKIDGNFVYGITHKVEYDITDDGLIIDITDLLA